MGDIFTWKSLTDKGEYLTDKIYSSGKLEEITRPPLYIQRSIITLSFIKLGEYQHKLEKIPHKKLFFLSVFFFSLSQQVHTYT